MGASDVFSVVAVLAAAVTGGHHQSSPLAPWAVPRGLEGSSCQQAPLVPLAALLAAQADPRPGPG